MTSFVQGVLDNTAFWCYAHGMKDVNKKETTYSQDYFIAFHNINPADSQQYLYGVDIVSQTSSTLIGMRSRSFHGLIEECRKINSSKTLFWVRAKAEFIEKNVQKTTKKSLFGKKTHAETTHALRYVPLDFATSLKTDAPLCFLLIAHPAYYLNAGREETSIITCFLAEEKIIRYIEQVLREKSHTQFTKKFLQELITHAFKTAPKSYEHLVDAQNYSLQKFEMK